MPQKTKPSVLAEAQLIAARSLNDRFWPMAVLDPKATLTSVCYLASDSWWVPCFASFTATFTPASTTCGVVSQVGAYMAPCLNHRFKLHGLEQSVLDLSYAGIQLFHPKSIPSGTTTVRSGRLLVRSIGFTMASDTSSVCGGSPESYMLWKPAFKSSGTLPRSPRTSTTALSTGDGLWVNRPEGKGPDSTMMESMPKLDNSYR